MQRQLNINEEAAPPLPHRKYSSFCCQGLTAMTKAAPIRLQDYTPCQVILQILLEPVLDANWHPFALVHPCPAYKSIHQCAYSTQYGVQCLLNSTYYGCKRTCIMARDSGWACAAFIPCQTSSTEEIYTEQNWPIRLLPWNISNAV